MCTHGLFSHLHIKGHLAYFYFLAIVNNNCCEHLGVGDGHVFSYSLGFHVLCRGFAGS